MRPFHKMPSCKNDCKTKFKGIKGGTEKDESQRKRGIQRESRAIALWRPKDEVL